MNPVDPHPRQVRKSLVVGLCIAFLGLIADQLINAWARERKKMSGLE